MDRKHLLTLTALAGVFLLLASACKPDYPKCKTDDHCSSHGEFCVNGMCQQCRSVADCKGPCQQCAAGKCAPVPGCCQTDANCAAGQKCRDGRCGPQCLSHDECPANQACQAGRCIAAQCRDNSACGEGQECVNYKCVDTAPPECSIERVHFDFDEHVLTSEARSIVSANAECMRQKGIAKVKVEGHCDPRGTEAYNISLGERRARSVRTYLERLGFSGVRTVSYGENRPLVRGYNESAYRQNRRAEFVPE